MTVSLEWAASLASVLAVSAVSFVALVTIGMRRDRVERVVPALVAFGAGALLGDAFLHLIPEAFERSEDTSAPSVLVLAGLVSFFVLERVARSRHHRDRRSPGPGLPPLAIVNLVGDAVHNFVDGALIAASWSVDASLGASTTLAVVLHELPQELGDFGILVHSGLPPARALAMNFGSGLAAVAGAVTTLGAGAWIGPRLEDVLVPLTAGGFVYIGAADLLPLLLRDNGLRVVVAELALFGAGIAAMAALTWVE
jgi:zinc and cadmium transporter